MKRFSLTAALLGPALLLAACNAAPGTGGTGVTSGARGPTPALPVVVSRTVTLGLPTTPAAELLVSGVQASKVSVQVAQVPAGLSVTAGAPTTLNTGDTAVALAVSGTANAGEVVKVNVTVNGSSGTLELPVVQFRSQPIQATGLSAAYTAANLRFQPDGRALMTASLNTEAAARHSLLQVDASGTAFSLLDFPALSVGDGITSQATAEDGTIWVTVRGTTAEGSYLLSRDGSGAITKYLVDAKGDTVNNATVASGRVWFTQYLTASVKALLPSTATVQKFSVPEKADSLVRGSDGNLYYASFYARPAIVQLNPGNEQTRSFDVGEAGRSLPTALTAAQGGSIWFIESLTGTVWQLDPATGKKTQLTLPITANPNALATSPSGQVWVADATNARLYTTFQTTSGVKTLVGIATPQGGAHALSISPSGKAWFEADGQLYMQQ